MLKEQVMLKEQKQTEEKHVWLKANYHFHVFHYRMPDTAAIAAVTPFVPSPLTVKMALIASLLQLGDVEETEAIAKHMHEIEVKIVPPKSAISFKAFLRYRSPPAVESEEKRLDETGSHYPSRPHMREYAVFQGNLEIYVRLPINIADYGRKALKNMRYLGAKDSLVTCVSLEVCNDPLSDDQCVSKLDGNGSGIVILLADFIRDVQIRDLRQLIPGSRDERMYEKSLYTIPGKIITKGGTKVFVRK